VAQLSGELSRSRDLDLEGRGYQVWVRRVLSAALVAFVICALANVFGQASNTTSADGAAASLAVRSPDRLRGGLIFEARFTIDAKRRLETPRLVLDNGWLEGMTLNSTVPAPAKEHSEAGNFSLTFDPIPAGDHFVFFTQWQVNPVNVGHRSQDVALYDGTSLIARMNRSVTVFP
jgi:hypothetical protein